MKILFVSTKQSKTNVVNFSKRYLIPSIIIGIGCIVLVTKLVSDKLIITEKKEEIEHLRLKNKALLSEYSTIEKQISSLKTILTDIQMRDNQLRHDVNLPKIDKDVQALAIGGADKEFFFDENLSENETELIAKQKVYLEELQRQFDFELNSYKKIVETLSWKEDSLQYIPLITPIPENVYRITDKYGLRMHPILKRPKRHHGLDLGCETGTPIYATADGHITFAGKNGGYGLFVKVKHRSKNKKIDFKYETRYGHMSKIYARRGQYVRRGDIIGEVGSTGISNAPHLHYEVRLNKRSLDPSEYHFVNF